MIGDASPLPLLDIFRARHRISSRILRTPLLRSDWLSRASGADVHLKLESLQIGHSFKLRGALNAVMARMERDADVALKPLVTASAGNHGRALAYACAQFGLRTIIYTPRNAPATKLDAIRRLGADLRAVGDGYEDAERQAKAVADTEGAGFVSAYSDRDVIAGAGTIALEVLEELPDVDLIAVPVGGGGLIAGIAAAVHGSGAGVEVVGAEAEASPAFSTSLREGRITKVTVGPTLADGLAGNTDPEAITFEMIRRTVTRGVLAPEDALTAAIRGLAAEEHLIVEGAGAVGIAALLAGRLEVKGRRVAVVVSGGNIDVSRLAEILRAS